MSLWYPNRPFPPKPHASTHIKGGVDEVLNLTNINNAIGFNVDAHASRHLAGGSDQLFDQNLNTTDTVKFAGVQLGSYVLDTLLANNKVPYAGSADSATQASKLVASGYTLDTLLADDKVPYAGSADSATQASKLVASGYTLDTLVANNKVPDSDKWDGTHRTDSQTIGGDIIIGGDLQVNGNNIKDSGGNIRIKLGTATFIYAANTFLESSGADVLYLRNAAATAGQYSTINFQMKNSAGTTKLYGRFRCHAYDWTSGSEDGRFEWWLLVAGSFARKMYLTEAGDLYIDGTYNTFSPEVGDTEEELINAIYSEVSKPKAPRDKYGRRLCPKCKKPIDECKIEHMIEYERKYGKDLGKIAFASAKLVLKLYDKVKKLEKKLS